MIMDLLLDTLNAGALHLSPKQAHFAVKHAKANGWDKTQTSPTVTTYHGPTNHLGYYVMVMVRDDETGRITRAYDWNHGA